MKQIVKKLLAALLISASSTLWAGEVHIPGSTVSFIAPDVFRPLSQQLINRLWLKHDAPDWAVGTPSGATSISYSLENKNIRQYKMKELRRRFVSDFNRALPGIQWIDSAIIRLDGQQWVYLEMTSPAIDNGIHNIMLITPYQNKMLIFNFNSTPQEIEQYKALFAHTMASIKLH